MRRSKKSVPPEASGTEEPIAGGAEVPADATTESAGEAAGAPASAITDPSETSERSEATAASTPTTSTSRPRKRVAVPDDAPPIPGVTPQRPKPKRSSATNERRRKPAAETVSKEKTRKRRVAKQRSEEQVPIEDLGPRPTIEELRAELDQEVKRSRARGAKERWPKPIPPPPGAPRIGVVAEQPVPIIENEVAVPHFFFGNISSESSEKAVLSEIGLASENGIHLHCLYLELPVDPRPIEAPSEEALRLLDSVLGVDPKAWVIFRVVFVPKEGWEEKYPDAVYRHPDGTLADPSVCSAGWWGEAERCLRKLVTEVARRKSGKRVIGYHLERGEWFNPKTAGYDTSPAALSAFREWVRARYFGDEVALRASWHDGSVTFETITIPDYQELQAPRSTLLTERRERRNVDYHDFLSDAYVERIGSLARAVKECSKGGLLVGCSYGYTFEFSHPHSGHLSLARLLKCPDIDFIAGPPSYASRLPGGSSPFPGPVDSIALAGKLFVLEEDYKTSLGRRDDHDEFNPLLPGPKELEAAHWRGTGLALAHSCGISWMDTWGSGWLDSPGIWSRAERVRSLFAARLSLSLSPPDVAVLIDERSLTMLQDAKLAVNLLANARDAVLRAGVSAGFYLLSDLTRREFPDCKLYLFLNAWDIGVQVRAAIREKLHRNGKTLVWWYAAGLLEYHRPASEAIRQVIGIALKAQPFASRPGTTITQPHHVIASSLQVPSLSSEDVYEPTYYVTDEEAEQVGVYTDTGLPSLVVREVRLPGRSDVSWRSVFVGEAFVSPALVRGLCRFAGVPVYVESGDVAHVRPPFLTIHASRGGRKQIWLPDGWEARPAFSTEPLKEPVVELRDGETKLLFIGPPDLLDRCQKPEIPAASLVATRQPIEERAAELAEGEAETKPTDETLAPVGERRSPEPAPSKARRRKPTKQRTEPRAPEVAPFEPEAEPPIGFRFRKKS